MEEEISKMPMDIPDHMLPGEGPYKRSTLYIKQEDAKDMKKRLKAVIVLLLVTTLFAGCAGNKVDQKQEKVTLVLGVFNDNTQVSKWVQKLNETSDEYEIEIKVYGNGYIVGDEGLTKLQAEIVAGGGPDLIDFGNTYSNNVVAGGIVENLYSFMEEDTAFDKDEYFMNILDAFAIEENLYAMPTDFAIRTFAAQKAIVGEISGWNYEQMLACYQSMGKDMILYPGEFKGDVFGMLCSGTINSLIDWDNGTCEFDSEEFIALLEFCNLFPDNLDWADDFSVLDVFVNGKALICSAYISDVYEITGAQKKFGDREITFVGYPMESQSGHLAEKGESMMSIGVNSKNKDLAWEVLKTFYSEEYQRELNKLPLRRDILEERLEEAMQPIYKTDEEGKQVEVPVSTVIFEAEDPIYIYFISQEDRNELLKIVEGVEVSNGVDNSLYEIWVEEIQSFFSGDKDAKTAADIIQKRVSIYVAEKCN